MFLPDRDGDDVPDGSAEVMLDGFSVPAENYLTFANDGQLVAQYPNTKGAPVRIRVDLYAPPDALALEFLRRFRVLALKESVDVELSIFQQDVPL